MSSAEKNWPDKRLGDIVKLTNGFSFKKSQWSDKGLPIIRIQNLNDSEKPFNYYAGNDVREQHLVKSGDLLFAWSGTPGTSFGTHEWKGSDAWLNQHIYKVEFDSTQVEKRYLVLAINRNLDEYIRQAHGGAGLAHITKGKFEGSTIPVPPLPEQCRIVARIEELFSRLDAGVAALRHAKAQLQCYRQSVLTAAVTGQLTQAWREENPDTEPAEDLLKRILEQRKRKWNGRSSYKEPVAKDSLNLDLPSTWTTTNIDSVIYGIEAGKNFKCDERPPTAGETGLVKISAVTWGKFDELESKTVTRGDQIRPEYLIQPGDFLLSRANTLELVGAPVIVEQITRYLMLSDKVLRFRFVERVEKFVLFWLRSILGRREIESRATGNQLSMRNIAQASLRAIPLPLPPLAEQHQIAAEVDSRTSAIDHLEAELDRQFSRSERLCRSTLRSAFSGNLTLLNETL